MVTDGATEAMSAEEAEFGDERIFDTISAAGGRSASVQLERLVGAVHGWAGAAGCTDDLTVLVLAARQES
jgi:serine phosphatase RsbU (regulator of sigma subunit)